MSKSVVNPLLAIAVLIALSSVSFAKSKSTPEVKSRKSRGSSVTTPGSNQDSVTGGSRGDGSENHDSPRGGQYEDQGGFVGGYDTDPGPLGLFKAQATVSLAAFDNLRTYVQSLSESQNAMLRDAISAGAMSAGLVVGARIVLRASRLVKSASAAGLLATVSATSSADVIFNDVAFAQDPYLFLSTASMSTEDLALWASSYQLEDKLVGVIENAALTLCGDNLLANGAEQFCSSL